MSAAGSRLLSALLFAVPQVSASPLDALDTDGVYTWRVAATHEAPSRCCTSWNRGAITHRACDLDHSGYSTHDGDRRDGVMQIYAVIDDGELERIRTLGPRCEVRSSRTIVDLGTVDSLGWLESQVEANDDALAAIAVHRGKRAVDALFDVLRNRQLPRDVREQALFWLVQSDSERAYEYLDRLFAGR